MSERHGERGTCLSEGHGERKTYLSEGHGERGTHTGEDMGRGGCCTWRGPVWNDWRSTQRLVNQPPNLAFVFFPPSLPPALHLNCRKKRKENKQTEEMVKISITGEGMAAK